VIIARYTCGSEEIAERIMQLQLALWLGPYATAGDLP
jgi:hypothetical protein